MTPTLVDIRRYPIKGIGRERLARVTLAAGAPLPKDRGYAVLHQGAADTEDWQPRRNFLVVAYGPRLAQVEATFEAGGRITLTHPDRPPLSISPEREGDRLIDWVTPLWPSTHSAPHRLVHAPAQGMADNGAAQVSILNLASLRAFSQHAGVDLDVARFRGNLILDGLAPWEEFDWIDKVVQIGGVRFQVTDRIGRCRATEANPDTGRRDVNTLKIMDERLGHRDFGVYASVADTGEVQIGDPVTALP